MLQNRLNLLLVLCIIFQLAGGGVSHTGVSPVPEHAIKGHAYHTYSLVSADGQVEFQFRHNVNGRSTYAEVSMQAHNRLPVPPELTPSRVSPLREPLMLLSSLLKVSMQTQSSACSIWLTC